MAKTAKAEFNPKIPDFVDQEAALPEAETGGQIENKTKESIIDFFSKLVKQKQPQRGDLEDLNSRIR